MQTPAEETIHSYRGVCAFFRGEFSSPGPSGLEWIEPPPEAKISVWESSARTGPQEVDL